MMRDLRFASEGGVYLRSSMESRTIYERQINEDGIEDERYVPLGQLLIKEIIRSQV